MPRAPGPPPPAPAGDLLGGLPRTRPQRRSPRRQAPAPGAARPEAEAAEPQAAEGDPLALLGTVVRAAGELAEIGLTLGARALRDARERLPGP